MTNLRRYNIENAIYFITCVTSDRIPYFKNDENIEIFKSNMELLNRSFSFELMAYVLLNDHFHFLLQPKNCHISSLIASFKKKITFEFKKRNNLQNSVSLWQRRFWDHIIRNESDFKFHLDYIHYNPVKHGHVKRPEDWRVTTYRDWMRKGIYEVGWGHRIIDEFEKVAFE